MYKSRPFALAVVVLLFLVAIAFFGFCESETSVARPNVILILADDLGIMDLCSYSSRINGTSSSDCLYETPNIDALASNGVSFFRAYTPPLCSPTRATIISGQYAAKFGFNNAFSMQEFRTYAATKSTPPPGFLAHDGINVNVSSTDKALISAVSSSALVAGGPDDQGQDIISIAEYMTAHDSAFIEKWHIGGGGLSDYSPKSQGFQEIAFKDEGWSDYYDWRQDWHNPGKPQGRNYLTDEITSQTVEWILDRKSLEKPFLLVVSHFAVHGPFQAKKVDAVEHYESKVSKELGGHRNAIYASMVQSLDESVGDIMRSLRDTGLAESTIVIFMSDNGGVVTTKGNNITSNQPFRGGKASMYEGGIRVPLIISWPKYFDKRRIIHTAVDATDIYPTIVSLAGYSKEMYASFGDGQSLIPLIESNMSKVTYSKPHFFYDPFYRKMDEYTNIIETTPKTVVIDGRFKLIQYHLGYSELYDLEIDPFEQEDASKTHPQVVVRLRKLAAEWEKTIPDRYRTKENPHYNSGKQSIYPAYRNDYYKQVSGEKT